MKTRGHYFKNATEAINNGYNVSKNTLEHLASIHYTGSVTGIRKQSWGYKCDVVRIGCYIYNLNSYIN